MDFDLRFFEPGPSQFTPPPAGRHRLPAESNLRLVGFFSKLRFASGRSTESPILRASPGSLVRSRDRIAAVPNALHFNPVFLGSEPKASYSRAPPRAMQQNSPVRDHVTIGILGEVIVNFLLVYTESIHMDSSSPRRLRRASGYAPEAIPEAASHHRAYPATGGPRQM